MSAIVDTNTSSWRKRRHEDDTPMDSKRPRYYFRLESESSRASEEDTESVHSLQDRETDVVRDTSDTSSIGSGHDEYEVEFEYEVASLSECDDTYSISSSGSDDMMLVAAAAAICDSSLETWITDCEDSDNSSLEDNSFGRTDFTTCIQCKSWNDNPSYRYCEKCFQDRKNSLPPRPRRYKQRRKNKENSNQPVKLDALRNCLSGLSQDSGIGSSQECPPLDLHQIVVPKHLTPGTSQLSSFDEKSSPVEDQDKSALDNAECSKGDLANNNKSAIDSGIDSVALSGAQQSLESSSFSSTDLQFDFKNAIGSSSSRKRQYSESSLSEYEVKRPKRNEGKKHGNGSRSVRELNITKSSDLTSEVSGTSSFSSIKSEDSSKNSELCDFCQDAPKDSIFLHTNIAHRCCCYKCAKRTLHTTKRCPICNRSVNKVVRIFTS